MQTQFTPETKQKSIPVFEAGHRIGSVQGDCLFKTIHGSKHIWRKNPSIGLSIASIQAAEAEGAVRACIRDAETGREYCATFQMIRAKGIRYAFQGFEEQLFLRLAWWTDHPVGVDPKMETFPLPLGI
jgi:hypothetical protein